MPEPFKQGSSVIVYVENEKIFRKSSNIICWCKLQDYTLFSETKYRAITGIDAVAKPGWIYTKGI